MHQFCLLETDTPNDLAAVWQFALEGQFAEQVFRGNWKYLMGLSQLANLQGMLCPTYGQLLEYLCSLIGVSCDTKEYRVLLGERLNNQRDAVRLQQQARETRKQLERTLSSLQQELHSERRKLHEAHRSLAYLIS
jgi:hypothetical protein